MGQGIEAILPDSGDLDILAIKSLRLSPGDALVHRTTDLSPVLYRPFVHRRQHRLQRPPERCQPILDAGRYLSEVLSFHQAVGLHLFELLGQRPMRDSRQVALELIESPFSLEQPENDHHLPTAGDHVECDLSGTTDLLGHNPPPQEALIVKPRRNLVGEVSPKNHQGAQLSSCEAPRYPRGPYLRTVRAVLSILHRRVEECSRGPHLPFVV